MSTLAAKRLLLAIQESWPNSARKYAAQKPQGHGHHRGQNGEDQGPHYGAHQAAPGDAGGSGHPGEEIQIKGPPALDDHGDGDPEQRDNAKHR